MLARRGFSTRADYNIEKEMDENNKMDPTGQMPVMDQNPAGSDAPAMPEAPVADPSAPAPTAVCPTCNHAHKADGSCDCNCDTR